MESERIECQYNDSKDLYTHLIDEGEITFATYVDDVYKKVLVLSVASYFERVISNDIINFARVSTGKDNRVVKLIEKKVIERQYHTLFDWKARNTNAFWGLFGDETKSKVQELIKNDETLQRAEIDFIEIGKLSNLLVHENFAEYTVNLTLEEIYNKYKSACHFVSQISIVLQPSFLKNR